ncbi:MAG: M16 family metallopeptidase [Chitinophagaceae bacterium]
MINRQLAPDIHSIKKINTGFKPADGNIFRIDSEEGVFKLEIIYPGAGFGMVDDKFSALYGMDLLMSGTRDKNAAQISEEIDSLGSYVFKGCDYYTSFLTVYGLNSDIENILNIVNKSASNCIYPLHEVEVFKNRKISELNINLNKTSFLANRSINQQILGKNHPFSTISDETLLQSVSQDKLLKFKNSYLKDPYFIFTGPSSTDIKEILIKIGYKISANPTLSIGSEIMPSDGESEIKIIKSGSTQNSIRLGKILPGRTEKDYFKISLFNLVLGGYFGSRLMKNIREEKGLTYGIHSSITPFKQYSVFKISSECNNALTETVRIEIEKEIQNLQNELISDDELRTAKNYLLGSLMRNFDGAFNISERYKSFLELESSQDFYDRYINAVNTITAQEIKECANNYFSPNTFKYCVAGEV